MLTVALIHIMTMMKRIPTVCLMIAGMAVSHAGEPSVELVPAYLTIAGERIEHRVERTEKGTAIGLLYKAKGDCLIDNSSLYKKEGRDLWLEDSSGKRLATLTMGASMGGPGYCAIEFRTDVLPPSGSTSIALSGSVPVGLFIGKEISDPVAFPIKKGEIFDISGVTFKIVRVSGQKFTLSMTSDEEAPPFELLFKDADGKDFKPDLDQGRHSSEEGKTTLTNTYNLPKGVGKLSVAVSTWKERKQMIVPVNIKLDLSSATGATKTQPTSES